jgi:hypothetical protein
LSKKILRVEYDFDFTLIGISSSVRDYRLCWYINKHLPLRFYRDIDLTIYNELGNESYHSCFKYSIENLETDLYLLSNKSGNEYIIPESKESDFFIVSTEALNLEEEKAILTGLNKIEVVQAAFMLDANSFKTKENLLFF